MRNNRPPAIPLSRSEHRPRRMFSNAVGRIEARSVSGATQIDVFGEIGFDGLTDAAFQNQLRQARGGPVQLQINSPGGDPFTGAAIFNLLRDHPGGVKVQIIGLCASAASIIAMAADTVVMAPASLLMIHCAWCIAIGSADDFKEVYGFLDQVDAMLAETYQAKTGLEPDDIRDMMRAETWMNPDRAIELGFADEVDETQPAANVSFDLKNVYHNVPAGWQKPAQQAVQLSGPGDLEKILRKNRISQVAARKIVAGGYPALVDDGSAEIAALTARVAAATAKLKEL